MSRAGTAQKERERETERSRCTHRRDRDFSTLIVHTRFSSHFRRGEDIISDGNCQSAIDRCVKTSTKSNGRETQHADSAACANEKSRRRRRRGASRKFVYYKSTRVAKRNPDMSRVFIEAAQNNDDPIVTNNTGLTRYVIIAASSLFQTLHKLRITERAKTATVVAARLSRAAAAAIIRQEQQTPAKGRFHRQNANTKATAAPQKPVDWSICTLVVKHEISRKRARQFNSKCT